MERGVGRAAHTPKLMVTQREVWGIPITGFWAAPQSEDYRDPRNQAERMRREASTMGTTAATPAKAESPWGCLRPHDSLAMAPGQMSVSTFPLGSPSPMFSLRPWRHVAEVTGSRTLTSGDPRFLLSAGGERKQCGRGGDLRIVSAEQGGQLVTSCYSRLVGGKPRASAMKTPAASCRRNVLELQECNHGEWESFQKVSRPHQCQMLRSGR